MSGGYWEKLQDAAQGALVAADAFSDAALARNQEDCAHALELMARVMEQAIKAVRQVRGLKNVIN